MSIDIQKLSKLGKEELEAIRDLEEELQRKGNHPRGGFRLLFPTSLYASYKSLFHTERPLNTLLA